MGIMISSKYIGKGYRYSVLIELEKYVFEKKGISQLSDVVLLYRENTIKSFKKAGFKQMKSIKKLDLVKKTKQDNYLITKEMYFDRRKA